MKPILEKKDKGECEAEDKNAQNVAREKNEEGDGQEPETLASKLGKGMLKEFSDHERDLFV